jgi:hypothetical protein
MFLPNPHVAPGRALTPSPSFRSHAGQKAKEASQHSMFRANVQNVLSMCLCSHAVLHKNHICFKAFENSFRAASLTLGAFCRRAGEQAKEASERALALRRNADAAEAEAEKARRDYEAAKKRASEMGNVGDEAKVKAGAALSEQERIKKKVEEEVCASTHSASSCPAAVLTFSRMCVCAFAHSASSCPAAMLIFSRMCVLREVSRRQCTGSSWMHVRWTEVYAVWLHVQLMCGWQRAMHMFSSVIVSMDYLPALCDVVSLGRLWTHAVAFLVTLL